MDNRKIGVIVILAFSVFTAVSAIPYVQASTIYVPDNYTTIQSAVNAAFPGDTIIVESGTYKENVIMDKKLTLIGDAFATIDAQGKGGAINITADHCVVTGFRCVNATKSRCAGIKVESNWNRIENNTVLNNKYGISFHHLPSPGLVEVRVNTPEYVEEKKTFDVTIDVECITDFNSGMFDLTFDNAVVKVDDVTDGSIDDTEIPVAMWVDMDSDTIRVMLELPETTAASGSGYLAGITFTVKGDEGEESALEIADGKLYNVWTEKIPANWHGAEVTIGVEEEEPTPACNIQTGKNTSLVQLAMNSPDAINVIVGGCSTENIGVTGSKWGDAVTRVGADNNLISNNNILSNQYGIYLAYSSNNTLMNNIVRSNSEEGFYLRHSANNKIMNNKIYENGDSGICMYDSSNSIIASNEIHNNNDDGIYLRNSGNSTLTNNTISGSDHNFAVYGELLSDYIQNIDVSNKVEGKPVYYLINKKNQRIPIDAGYVGIVNSTNITMNDLRLTNNSQGVLLAFSSNSKIENVKALNNKYGIYMDHSSDNVLMNNKVSNNNDDGIYLEYSMNNEIKSNEITENKDNGIYVYDSSSNNTIQNNEVRKNDDDGICLKRSTNNDIRDNEIHENKDNGICAYDSSNNNTIQNNEVRVNRDDGICLKRSTNTEIMNNKIHENRDNGILLSDSSNNNRIENNEISDNRRDGLDLDDSTNNIIASNEIYNNKDDGIYLRNSGNSTLTDNIISRNNHNFAVYGKLLSDYIQNIDTSNKVDGKSVYYLVNKKNQRIPSAAGYVGVVNSTNIIAKVLRLTNNSQGVLLAFSSNSKIENVNVSNNKYGIYMDHSSDNVLMNNKVSNNDDDGIYLKYSMNNEIKSNEITENKDNGICVYYSSSNNTIQNNEVRKNDDDGIYLRRSTNNEIEENEIHEDNDVGIRLSDSSNNTIVDNEISDNRRDGLDLYDSTNNEITSNEICENNDAGIYLKRSTNNDINNNKIHDNRDNGIYLKDSNNNTIINNKMELNGLFVSHSCNNSVDKNTVNGKPLVYLEGIADYSVTNAGQVIAVNCNKITVADQNLSYASVGIEFWSTNDSLIMGNNVSNNVHGIYLRGSSNSLIMNNNASSNNDCGIYMEDLSNCTIMNNNVSLNNVHGIYLKRSSNSKIMNNTASNNADGIYLLRSVNNEIMGNKITENKDDGFCLYDSSNNNTIQNNEIRENMDDGIYLERSTNTEIKDNEIYENRDKGISISHLYSSNITNNNCSNNKYGIHLWYSNNNFIYLNNFINNMDKVYSYKSTNLWNSTEEITCSYNETTYESYLGNYWSDYTGTDADGDGIGDNPYNIDEDKDNYPLMEPWERYVA